MSVVRLVKCCVDVEQLGQVALLLGHLISDDGLMCSQVLDENCIERFAAHIENFTSEVNLKDKILFFMQSCFKQASPKQLLPAIRTFVRFLQNYRLFDSESLLKMLLCLQDVFKKNQTLLMAFASQMLDPLLHIYQNETQSNKRAAATLLGEVCALPSSAYCVKVLEGGFL